jgi:hypothetical protein
MPASTAGVELVHSRARDQQASLSFPPLLRTVAKTLRRSICSTALY